MADEEHSSPGVQEVLRHVRTDAAVLTRTLSIPAEPATAQDSCG